MNSLPSIEPYTVEEYREPEPPATHTADTTVYTEEAPKRKFPFFLIILGLVVFGLIALGFLLLSGGGGGTPDDDDDQTPTNVVLQVHGAFLDEDIIKPLFDEYTTINPHVTIQYANNWPSGNYDTAALNYQKELNRIISGNDPVEVPDIFFVQNTWAGDYEQYAQSSTIFTGQLFETTFYPAAVTDLTNGGIVFGVPLWMDTFAIVYNKDMLQAIQKSEPDDNWPALKATAEKLTKITNGQIEQAGFAAGTSANTGFYFEIINLLLRQNGVAIVDANNAPAFSIDPSSVEAFEFYRSFLAGSVPTWNRNQKDASAVFLEEKLAMLAIPSWRLREILNFNEENDLNIDIGVAQIPQIEGQEQEIINWADYWAAMVSTNRPEANKIESWKLLKWLTDEEQQKKLHENVKQNYGYFGNLYSRIDMQDELDDDEYLKVYNESLPYAESWYMVKGREVKLLLKEFMLSGTAVSSSRLTSLENDIKELLALKGRLEIVED